MKLYTGAEAIRTPEIMEQIHRCGQEILDEFVKICEENGFRYYLAAGTLLGAVRHKGPIPWDDDVDVFMPRADADAFKRLMLGQPEDAPYHIQCYENEPTFAHFYFHFNKRGTLYKTQVAVEKKRRYMELWLDVFPLDDCRGPRTVWDKVTARYIRSFMYELEIRTKLTKQKPSLGHRAVQLIFKWMSDDRIWAFADRLMRRDNGKPCDYYVSWTGNWPLADNILKKSWFEPACRLLYAGKYYFAPGNWDQILTKRYGDYMQLPPEEKRVGHAPIEIGLE